jgi:hypothetical protein
MEITDNTYGALKLLAQTSLTLLLLYLSSQPVVIPSFSPITTRAVMMSFFP